MALHETIIIGGGIAGLACARRLNDLRRDFLLVTDRLGGRMHAGPTPLCNFGATYITSDYRQVGRFVGRGPRIRFRDVWFLHRGRMVNFLRPGSLRHAWPVASIYRLLVEFRREFNRLRGEAHERCQLELLAGNPLLLRYTQQPALDFVGEHRLQAVHERFIEPIVRSTLFVSSGQVNAFYYLAVLMPILIPTYVADFSQTLPRLTAGYEERIVWGKVSCLKRLSHDAFRVRADDRRWQTRNVVVATPCHNTRQFCSELDHAAEDGIVEVGCNALHVQGDRRAEFLPGKLVFLDEDAASPVLFPLRNSGCDLLFSREAEPDLSRFYGKYRIVSSANWKTAVVLSGSRWRCLAPQPGLYTIGDYNICGLEDSFLTGLYAANHIARSAASPQPPMVASGIDRVTGQVGVKA